MKRILLLISLVFVAKGYAQTTIVSPSISSITGMVVNAYQSNDSVSLNFPKSGMNSWSFTNVPNTAQFIITQLDPSTTPFAAQFPTANFAQGIAIPGTTTNIAYLYGNISNDSITGLGSAGAFSETYTNPNVSFRFPWAYGNTVSDLSVTNSGQSKYDVHTYIGYGNITTPFGYFGNVALIKEISTVNNITSAANYKWIDISTCTTVFEVDSADGEAELYNIPLLSSLKTNENIAQEFKVYPTVFTDNILVNLTSEQTNSFQIKIIDITGKVVYENNFNSNMPHEINLNSLNKGIYTLQTFKNSNNILNQKIVKN